MNQRADVDTACTEISGEVAEMARWLAGSQLTPQQLRLALAEMERRKLERHGFALRSAVSEKSHVKFSLRFADSGELCASLDVDPVTGEVTVQHTVASCCASCESETQHED
jgi:hypothetical protein